MDQQQFLKKQAGIYAGFRDLKEVRAEGLMPGNLDLMGYLIAFRHSARISEEVGKFSKRIANCVPAVVYDKESVHTTISDYKVSPSLDIDKNILNGLCRTVAQIRTKSPSINYLDWVYNKNTVIVVGLPDENFLGISQQVFEEAEKQGIELRLPWGAHITASRFAEKRKPEQLDDFSRLMLEAPSYFGVSIPEFIDVGYFKLSPSKLEINTYERFPIS